MIHEAQFIADIDADFIQKSKLIKDSTFCICSAVNIGLRIIVTVTTIDAREYLCYQCIMVKVRETEIQCMFYLSNGKRGYE